MQNVKMRLMSFNLSELDKNMIEAIKVRNGYKSQSDTLRKLVLNEYSKGSKVKLSGIKSGLPIKLKLVK